MAQAIATSDLQEGQLGDVELSLLLRDGTLIEVSNTAPQAQRISSRARFLVSVPMDIKTVHAIAVSPPRALQWSVVGKKFVQVKSDKHGVKYYRAAFSCLRYEMHMDRKKRAADSDD